MIAFEKYLLDQGYEMFISVNNKLVKPKKWHLSTMGNLDHRYIKGDKEIRVELSTMGVIIIRSLAGNLVKQSEYNYMTSNTSTITMTTFEHIYDEDIIRAMGKYSNKEILDAIENDTILMI